MAKKNLKPNTEEKIETVETSESNAQVKTEKAVKTIKIKATELICSPYCTLFKGAVAEVPEAFGKHCIQNGIAEKA